jgi:hypothetical protein
MRSTRKSIIALSMMVVVPAVAHKSAAAEERETGSETGVETPVAAPAAEQEAASGASEDETAPKAKRKPKAAAAAPAEETPLFGGPAQVNHKFQTGLSIMPGTGYRLIVPYQDGLFCGDSSGDNKKRVCAHVVPAFLDFQLAFGVAARADVILDLRFGLQSDPAVPGSHQFTVAPGLRFWLDQDVDLKFYTTLQFMYDHTDFSNSPPIRSSDVGMRNANGLMYDPIRNVGFFVQFGETIGFMRWFRIDLDVGLGAQIRFP